jgi:hypothetical protein
MNRLTYALLLVNAVYCLGCAPTALSTGEPVPPLQVAGWTNGSVLDEGDLAGRVVVLEVFATW